jgi:glycosyltransferase involved in cell wall biosynthesis
MVVTNGCVSYMPLKKPKVVVAGQVPPPLGGQNIMIQKAVTQFGRSNECESVHLPFFFTPDFKTARKGSVRKIFELLRVVGRLIEIRRAGPIDVILYPTGGPQRVPMVRDVLLLPWVLAMSRRVVLHFHAAGIADELARNPGMLVRLVAFLYRCAFAAVVMTNFNRRDPEAIGIERITIVPCRVDDSFDPQLVSRGDARTLHLLYVGHLCSDKGTPELLEAFAALRRNYPEAKLELVGECLPPFGQKDLEQCIDQLGIRSHVCLSGVLTDRAKAKAFGRADLFVFPTVAPYESFGLVLAEAMAWGLPIVATRWRGNSDVLTPDAGAICYAISSSLANDTANALQQAVNQRKEWMKWGRTNRLIFEQRYSEKTAQNWLVEPILSLLPQH